MHNIYIYIHDWLAMFFTNLHRDNREWCLSKETCIFLDSGGITRFPHRFLELLASSTSPDAACVLKREMNCHLQHSGFKNPETASVVHSTQWATQWAIVAIVWDVINWWNRCGWRDSSLIRWENHPAHPMVLNVATCGAHLKGSCYNFNQILILKAEYDWFIQKIGN